MPIVEVQRKITGVSADHVWSIARRLTEYPNFMEQVIRVESDDHADDPAITNWTVLFNGNELRWTERDRYDHEKKLINFEQIDGDLAEWSGSFEAKQQNDGVLAQYRIHFDLGIPALADVLHPLGERAIRDNCNQMLQEIETRSRKAAHA